jgi:branched-chain amino acid aminotransferase
MAEVYINGEFVKEDEARISVFDHGFLYGDGIFETLRSYASRIFRMEDHLIRLFESAHRLSLHIPWEKKDLQEILLRCLTVNRLEDAVLRLSISRGVGPLGLDPDLCQSPTLIVLTRPFQGYPETMYEQGIGITLVSIRKNSPHALDPRIKSTNFLNNILAKIQAKEAGADEGILLNCDGMLAEGTVSNLFFIRDQVLCTPDVASGILEGVSRKVVLEIAEQEKIPVEEGAYLPERLLEADEVFLTNTTYEVMPVTRMDQRVLPVGLITRQIRHAFKNRVFQGYNQNED